MVRTERVTVISVRVRTSLKAEPDFRANVETHSLFSYGPGAARLHQRRVFSA